MAKKCSSSSSTQAPPAKRLRLDTQAKKDPKVSDVSEVVEVSAENESKILSRWTDSSSSEGTVIPSPPVVVDESGLGDIKRNIVLKKCGQFKLVKKLGEGAYGIVISATDRRQNKFALKIAKGGSSNGHRREQKVFNLIQLNGHRNLLELQTSDVLKKPEKGWSANVLVLPLMGGSIWGIMKTASLKAQRMFSREHRVLCHYPSAAIAIIGKQIADGMLHLERLGVYHLDLKTDNVLFCNGGFVLKGTSAHPEIKMESLAIKIADYGVCAFHINLEPEREPYKVQTMNYRAPEIFVGLPFTEKSDVWSFGAVLSELATGMMLFCGNYEHPTKTPANTQLDMIQKTLRQYIPKWMWDEGEKWEAKYRVRRPGPGYKYYSPQPRLPDLCIHSDVRELVKYILRVDYTKRPSFEDVLAHPFFKN